MRVRALLGHFFTSVAISDGAHCSVDDYSSIPSVAGGPGAYVIWTIVSFICTSSFTYKHFFFLWN